MDNLAAIIWTAIPTFAHQALTFVGGLFVQNPWIPFAAAGLAFLRFLADHKPSRR